MSMFHELMMKKKGMPSRYQEVEYIESDGTQYIDTGIYGKNTTDYEIKWNETGNDTYYGILGSRVSTTVDRLTIIGSSAELYVSNYNGSTYQTTFTTGALRNKDIIINKTGENLKLLVDGTEQSKTILISQNYQTPTTLKLGCIDTNGTLATFLVGRIYYCKLYDNNRLVRNFIPVYDTLTNKYGMWESVQGKFYGNDGTGDFKGSIVGYTVVGSPTITDGVVSGFTTSDYVHILNFPTTYDSIEFVTKVKTNLTSESSSNSVFALGNGSLSQNKFLLYFTPQQVVFRYRSTDNTSKTLIVNYVSSANTFYYIRVRFYTNKIVLGISVDKNNWVEEEVADSIIMASSQNLRYGVITNNTWALVGSIDMNETTIKINNKLWFNGQQA